MTKYDVSRKNPRLIHESVTRCVTRCSVTRNRWKFEHVIRNSMENEIWSIYNDKYFEIGGDFTRKINKTYSSCVSVVISGDFCCFKLVLPSLLSLSKDDVKLKGETKTDKQRAKFEYYVAFAVNTWAWLFSLKCYQRGRDAVKLTAKRIRRELKVAKFQDEYSKILFWEL